MLNVIKLNVVILSVVALNYGRKKFYNIVDRFPSAQTSIENERQQQQQRRRQQQQQQQP